jgi:hypothetical protein
MAKKAKSNVKAPVRLADVLAGPIILFREQTHEAFNRVEAAASRIEELMGRTDATFLGGSLMPVMTYAILHQAREETDDAVRDLEKGTGGEPSDVVDRTDFFASALGEMAALLKILSTMELEDDPALREDWEKLADDLQALATIVQRATEKFEDAIDEADPEPVAPLININL